MIQSIDSNALRLRVLEDTDFKGRTVLDLVKPHFELLVLFEDFIQARYMYGKDARITLKKAIFVQNSLYYQVCESQSLLGLKSWKQTRSKGRCSSSSASQSWPSTTTTGCLWPSLSFTLRSLSTKPPSEILKPLKHSGSRCSLIQCSLKLFPCSTRPSMTTKTSSTPTTSF